MKFLVSLLALGFAVTVAAPDSADAQRSYRKGKAKSYNSYNRNYYGARPRRPASVGPNGLCQRDTGTPTSQLNFRNRCDTEEFWRRMEDMGSRGGRF